MKIQLGVLQGLQRLGWYGSHSDEAEIIVWNPSLIPPYKGFNYFIPLHSCPTDRIVMNYQFCPVGAGQLNQIGVYDFSKSAEFNLLKALELLGNLIPLDYKLDSGNKVHARIGKYLISPRKLTKTELDRVQSFEIGMCKELGIDKLGGGPYDTN